MKVAEVLDFLKPQLDDPIQIVFFVLILVLMSVTVISTHRRARPASWELKWSGGTPNDSSDDLDIEHGSVTDLWNAVATAPEKLAEIMPGMLLVIGLLGTFIGLGLALNHASNILGHSSALSASGASDSMQELMLMLQGLGTKFKTSTWGITGFVLLKIWSELTRFEEKRLSWVIGKVKTELEKRKHAQSSTEAVKQEILFAKIGGAAETIIMGFSEQMTLLMVQNKDLHYASLGLVEGSVKSVREYLATIHSEIRATTEESTKDVRDNLRFVHTQTRATIESSAKQVCEGLAAIHAENRATSAAMVQFTESTKGVVENMADAAQGMASGADKVGDAGSELVSAISAFERQFTVVLDKVGSDLDKAIRHMSSQASETLGRGSAELGAATKNISAALGVLSSDVKETMGEVKDSINKALLVQQKAASEFALSSQALSDNMEASTGIVEKLGMPIEHGLKSVSEAGQRMRSVGDKLDRSFKSMEEIVSKLAQLPTALKPLETFPGKQQALISALEPLGSLPQQQDAVLKELRGLRDDLMKEKASVLASIGGELSKQQDDILAELHGVRDDFVNERTSILTRLSALLAQRQAVLGSPHVSLLDLNSSGALSDLANVEWARGD